MLSYTASEQKMRDFWGRNAHLLVEERLSLNKGVFAQNLRLVLKDKHVLELGCGSGLLAMHLAPFCASVTGVDFTAPLIAQANERKDQHPYGDKAKFIHADIFVGEHLAKTYDAIVGCMVIHEIPASHYPELITLLKTHITENGFCLFEENSYFNRVYQFVHENLVGRFGLRKIGSPDEMPFDSKRFEMLQAHFKFATRAVWTFNFFRRLYIQFLSHVLQPRLPQTHAYCIMLVRNLDYVLSRKLGDSTFSRSWSLNQIIYASDTYSYAERFAHVLAIP